MNPNRLDYRRLVFHNGANVREVKSLFNKKLQIDRFDDIHTEFPLAVIAGYYRRPTLTE